VLVVLVMLIVSAAVLAASHPGHAQMLQAPELHVLALDGVLTAPDSMLRVQVEVRNPGARQVDGLRVTGTLHRPVSSRFAFREAVQNGGVGETVHQLEPVVASPLPAGASWTVELRATALELGVGRPEQQGVYPLRIRLERGGLQLREVTTSVVVITGQVGQPLRLALLVPIDHAPGLLSDGGFDHRLSGAVATGGTLDRIARDLQAVAGVPLTLAPSGYLLDRLGDLADGRSQSQPTVAGTDQVEPGEQFTHDAAAFLARLRTAAGRSGVEQVALPYGPADLVAQVRAGLNDEARRELVEGASAVERATGQPVLPGVLAPPDGLDSATLEVAEAEAVDTVILDEQSLRMPGTDRPPATTPSPVRRLTSGEAVLVPDPFVEDALALPAPGAGLEHPDEDRVLTAQQVIAETAVVYFERPFAVQPRGLLLRTPPRWEPVEGMLAELLTRMRAAPWLRCVGLTGLRREVEASRDDAALVYTTDSRRRELSPGYLRRLTEARTALGELTRLVPDGDPTVSRLDRALLAAAAVWYRDAALSPDGADRIARVQATVERILGAVRVEDQPVTLTSIKNQQVPVTVVSEAEMALRVRVRMEATPIEFEKGHVQTVVLEPGLPTTVVFPVRVLTPGGTFAANVFVEDPSGTRPPLARGSIQVRSATYSIAALVLTAGAGLFLLAWWVREVVRQRGRRAGFMAARKNPAG
jgi:hypothetical protein